MSAIERVYGARGETHAIKDLRIVIGYAEVGRVSDEQKKVAIEARGRLSQLSGGHVVDLMLRMRACGLVPLAPEVTYTARSPATDARRGIGRP